MSDTTMHGERARPRARFAPAEDTPPPAPGFAGPGHTAVAVIEPRPRPPHDPFVMLMDDRIDFAVGQRIGGAHPHAGLETFTLVLEGTLFDAHEGELHAGDAVWMSAGRGVVHSEHVESRGRTRVLQLWVGLPSRTRRAAPRFEVIERDLAPVRREGGAEVRLYAGRSGELVSPTETLVPVTALELRLAPHASIEHVVRSSESGFVYVIEGALDDGEQTVREGQVAWLERTSVASSELTLRAGASGARAVLYVGERSDEPLVQHGPFVAGTPGEIAEMYTRFRAGLFPGLSELSRG